MTGRARQHLDHERLLARDAMDFRYLGKPRDRGVKAFVLDVGRGEDADEGRETRCRGAARPGAPRSRGYSRALPSRLTRSCTAGGLSPTSEPSSANVERALFCNASNSRRSRSSSSASNKCRVLRRKHERNVRFEQCNAKGSFDASPRRARFAILEAGTGARRPRGVGCMGCPDRPACTRVSPPPSRSLPS